MVVEVVRTVVAVTVNLGAGKASGCEQRDEVVLRLKWESSTVKRGGKMSKR